MKALRPIAGPAALLVCIAAGCQAEVCTEQILKATAAEGIARPLPLSRDAGFELAIHAAMDRGFEVVAMDADNYATRLSGIDGARRDGKSFPRTYLAIFAKEIGPDACEISVVYQDMDGTRTKTDWATRLLDDIRKAALRYKTVRT